MADSIHIGTCRDISSTTSVTTGDAVQAAFTPQLLPEADERKLRQDLRELAERYPGPENTFPRGQAIDELMRRYGKIPAAGETT